MTNEHVVEACSRVRIQPSGETLKLVSKDARNDLAVLKFENANAMSNLKLLPTLLRENQTLSLGEAVTVFGYPLPNLLSPTRVLTTGVVNALSGTRNDTSEFQMSATVQPGSSGGPVFDNAGLLIGLVKARLLPSAPANPQNINFAIKLNTIKDFLEATNTPFELQSNLKTLPAKQLAANAQSKVALSTQDIARIAEKSTVQIECF